MIQGIDVSDWEPAARWDDAAFGFARATEGDTGTDAAYARHRAGMEKAGLVPGAFHVARPGGDPGVQARHFLDHAADGLLAVDVRVSDGLPPAEVADFARRWCAEVRRLSGIAPIVRTMRHFAAEGNCDGLGEYPLWIAAPGHPMGRPAVPAPWVSWSLHQYANSPVNLSVFAGTPDELAALATRN